MHAGLPLNTRALCIPLVAAAAERRIRKPAVGLPVLWPVRARSDGAGRVFRALPATKTQADRMSRGMTAYVEKVWNAQDMRTAYYFRSSPLPIEREQAVLGQLL